MQRKLVLLSLPAAILPPIVVLDCGKKIFWAVSWVEALAPGSKATLGNAGLWLGTLSVVLPALLVLTAAKIPGKYTVTVLLTLALLIGLAQLLISTYMGVSASYFVIFRDVCPAEMPANFAVHAALFYVGYVLRLVGYGSAAHFLIKRA